MREVAPKTESIGELLLCFAGPMVWAGHFFIMYGAEALACTAVPAHARNTIFLVIATATTAIALVTLVGFVVWDFARSRSSRQAGSGFDGSSFLRDTGTALAVLAMLGVLWVALPATLLTLCASTPDR